MKKPNILYVFADQLSLKSLSLYGRTDAPATPNIDRLAREGVTFTSSYCTTPQCSPSRSSILTGNYPHRTGVIGNFGMAGASELRLEDMNIGRFFHNHGYATGYFGKWHLGKTELERYGFEDSYSGQNDEETIKRTLAFLDKQHTDNKQPWLCVVSINNPHDIYKVNKHREEGDAIDLSGITLPVNASGDMAGKPEPQRIFRDEDQGKPLSGYSTDDWKYYRGYYNRLVEIVDGQFGQILDKLAQIGQDHETLIVLTADHGDMLGAHRTPFKGPMMYNELAQIPLIFRLPGVIPTNERRDQLVINADHFPTLCELAGFEAPHGLDGISLKAAIGSEAAPVRDQLVLQYYAKQKWVCPIRTIVTHEWKYNLYASGEEELYELTKDPGELINLSDASERMNVKSELKQKLLDWMNKNEDPFFTYKATDRLGKEI